MSKIGTLVIGQGFGPAKFGMTEDEILDLFGKPDEREEESYSDDPDDKTSSQGYMGTPSEFWSGEEGVKLDTMKISMEIGWTTEVFGDINGYLFDQESNTFKRITEEIVPANRVFLAIPKYILDQIEEGFVPDVIYLSEEAAESASVNGVRVDEPVKNGKTYTIDGKQVTSPKQKGVYIYDGKKVIFRK